MFRIKVSRDYTERCSGYPTCVIMSTTVDSYSTPAGGGRRRRADARRNEQALLDAAAVVFVASGVNAPIREIAAAAGVGVGTIYRHFPQRADLVVAVYRHQVETCAAAAPTLLADSESTLGALRLWLDLFVEFLVTKHGLAEVMQADVAGLGVLHGWFLDQLLPACAMLLDAAVDAGEARAGLDAYELMRGVGNLCIGAENDPRYDPARLIDLIVNGLSRPEQDPVATDSVAR